VSSLEFIVIEAKRRQSVFNFGYCYTFWLIGLDVGE